MLLDLLGEELQTGDPIAQTGLLYHPSIDVHDASKIQTFLDSPRRYFFQYVVGWIQEDPIIHLEFGSSWHEAMEHLLLSLNGPDPYGMTALAEAYQLFYHRFRQGFPSDLLDLNHGAKDPDNALKALVDYVKWWEEDKRRLQTLYTEVAVAVPVNDSGTRIVHGKLDSIMLQDGKYIFSMEHKTTGKKSNSWSDQWGVITQPLIYNHALRMLYDDHPEYLVRGVIINGAILRKETKTGAGNEFVRFPIAKTDTMMREGLWRVNHWLDQIKWNFEQLLEHTQDDDILAAFPCNGTSCSKYGCPFAAFCEHWPNPLQRADAPPPGFKENRWDPRRLEVKNEVNLATEQEIHPTQATP